MKTTENEQKWRGKYASKLREFKKESQKLSYLYYALSNNYKSYGKKIQ